MSVLPSAFAGIEAGPGGFAASVTLHALPTNTPQPVMFHLVAFHQVFGIGDNGTWRWRFLPLQVDTGAIVELVRCYLPFIPFKAFLPSKCSVPCALLVLLSRTNSNLGMVVTGDSG